MTSPFKTTDWVAAHLDDPNVQIIDTTMIFLEPDGDFLRPGHDEYEKAHLPGAYFVDQLTLQDPEAPVPFTAASPANYFANLADAGIDTEKTLIAYDSGPQVGVDFKADSWAGRFVWQARAMGLEEVYVMVGGLGKWQAEGRPVTATHPDRDVVVPGSAEGISERLIERPAVKKALAEADTVLLDVLPKEQFTGEIAPFGEERPGHIPGAVNLFYGDFADPETGALLPDEDLREKFEAAGVLEAGKRPIVYCGFGVAASFVALLLEHLGQEHVQVYDGSLQDWALESDEPLEC